VTLGELRRRVAARRRTDPHESGKRATWVDDIATISRDHAPPVNTQGLWRCTEAHGVFRQRKFASNATLKSAI
jgi:hypothetical protein